MGGRKKKVNFFRKNLEFLGKPPYLFLIAFIHVLHFLIGTAKIFVSASKTARAAPASRREHVHQQKRVVSLLKFPRSIVFLSIMLLALSGSAIAAYEYVVKDLPTPADLRDHRSKLTTHIVDRNGTELFKIFKDENRSLVHLNDIPAYLIDATVAIEDKEFWNHPGFSLSGIGRAFYYNYLVPKSRRPDSFVQLQGGSTITQQLVKTTLLSPERTLQRKLRELILSMWVERTYSKEEILDMYLNEVSYGGTAYGIQEAAQQYFGKDARDVTLSEAALLAGLPAAPTIYSPLGANPERAKIRQDEVLRRMVEDRYITPEAAQKAKAAPITLKTTGFSIQAPHFVMYVRDLLVQEYGEDVVNHGGLKVTTTLDLPIQQMAQRTVADEVKKLGKLRAGNGAALVTDPKNGDVLAMVGSADFFDFSRDGQVNVTLRPRQPGSSIKPVNYAAALARGFTPASIILDAPITYRIPGSPPYAPVNYDGKFHGPVTLRTALASSYNVPAVKVLSTIGVAAMIDQGEKMGITTWKDRSRFGLSLTLGGGEIRMVDMAEMYGTLANYGVHIPLNPILKIEDSHGKILYQKNGESGNRALPADIAYQLTDILSDNDARAPAFGTRSVLSIPGRRVAVKTGTTNNLRDNWTFGYTTAYVVSAWVGNNDNSPMSYIASGITGASPIWNRIMSELLAAQPDASVFPKPDSLVTAKICPLTGQLACDACPGRDEWFLPGTEPTESCRSETIEEMKRKQRENPIRDKILQGTSTVR